jgi:hypothetical protein
MKTRFAVFTLSLLLAALSGCGSLPGASTTTAGSAPRGSHKFQCHTASPGPCAYVVFNESGSVRETFILPPGESRTVGNIHPHTTFCLAVEKPLDPPKCQRLGLDGKPPQK